MLLGVDIGGSGLKVGVYTHDGETVAFASQGYSFTCPHSGWAEIDPRVWWQAFCDTLKSIALKVNLHEITCIGISGTNATLGIDKDGEVVMPGIMFNDLRSVEECEYINNLIGEEELLSITGNRVMPGTCSAATILWLKNNKGDEYNKIHKFVHPSSYFVYRLTGEAAVDRSRAVPSLLFDIDEDRWSELICGSLEIDIETLPEIRDSDEVIGSLSKQAAKETGLSTKAVVVTGGNDTACAALGMGITEHYMAGDNSGTAGVLFVDVPRPVRDSRFMTTAHVLRNHYLAMAPMSSVGSSLNWFKNEFCYLEQAEAQKQNEDVFNLLCEAAKHSSPGANGLVFLPYLMGERAPIWDPYAKGVFFGITLNHKKHDFIRSILESSGYGTRWNLSIIEETLGAEISEIIAAGGQAKSSFWLQLKAGITKKVYLTREIREAATFGAAILAGKGLGVGCEITTRKYKETFCPDCNKNDRRLYDKNYDLYRKLYSDLKSSFREN